MLLAAELNFNLRCATCHQMHMCIATYVCRYMHFLFTNSLTCGGCCKFLYIQRFCLLHVVARDLAFHCCMSSRNTRAGNDGNVYIFSAICRIVDCHCCCSSFFISLKRFIAAQLPLKINANKSKIKRIYALRDGDK